MPIHQAQWAILGVRGTTFDNLFCYLHSYGNAGDMHSYSKDCTPFGRFAISLAGTPWVINNDMTWMWDGQFANGDNSQGSAVLDDLSKYDIESHLAKEISYQRVSLFIFR